MGSMSPMIGVTGMRGLLVELDRITAGVAPPYPFYCVLVATGAPGVDSQVSQFIRRNWEELDAVAGEECAMFCLREGSPDWYDDETCPNCRVAARRFDDVDACVRCGYPEVMVARDQDHAFEVADLYQLAALLGVPFRSLPCAVFLVEPNARAARLAVPFERVAPYGDDGELTRAFRIFVDAMRCCADAPVDERLDALCEQLDELLAGSVPGAGAERRWSLQGAAGAVNTTAETVESTRVLASASGGIAVAILKFFGFA